MKLSLKTLITLVFILNISITQAITIICIPGGSGTGKTTIADIEFGLLKKHLLQLKNGKAVEKNYFLENILLGKILKKKSSDNL